MCGARRTSAAPAYYSYSFPRRAHDLHNTVRTASILKCNTSTKCRIYGFPSVPCFIIGRLTDSACALHSCMDKYSASIRGSTTYGQPAQRYSIPDCHCTYSVLRSARISPCTCTGIIPLHHCSKRPRESCTYQLSRSY